LSESSEVLKDQVLKELLTNYLTQGTKKGFAEDKTQLEMKVIVPKSEVSVKNRYFERVDEETGEKIVQVVPFHTLFKEHLTEDLTTSSLDEDELKLINSQFYCSQMIQKLCLMSGFPFKKNSLDLRNSADYFTDLSNTDLALSKSKGGFGTRMLKSDFSIASSKQELIQAATGEEPKPKKKWWRLGR
jgi:hypothetical protein